MIEICNNSENGTGSALSKFADNAEVGRMISRLDNIQMVTEKPSERADKMPWISTKEYVRILHLG